MMPWVRMLKVKTNTIFLLLLAYIAISITGTWLLFHSQKKIIPEFRGKIDQEYDVKLFFDFHDKSKHFLGKNFSINPSAELQKTPKDNSQKIPKWQTKIVFPNATDGQGNKQLKYFLTTAARTRLYADDKAKWTIAELKQWLHYLFWSGVEHIYLCIHFLSKKEFINTVKPLNRYVELGLVTLLPWNQTKAVPGSKNYVTDNTQNQEKCYNHIVQTYRNQTMWQMAIDMDEYPYCSKDQNEGFLQNYLRNIPDDISQIKMNNYLMLGQGDRTRNLTIERITRITPRPKNALVKPLYRTQYVLWSKTHYVTITNGRTIIANDTELKFLHYWGARLQNWGSNDTVIFDQTVEFNDARVILGPILRQSLISFGEHEAFSTNTGP